MAIIIKDRAEKTFEDGFKSRWNSAFLPIVYEFNTDLFPVNTASPTQKGNTIEYDSGRRGTRVKTTFPRSDRFIKFEKITVTNSGISELDGEVFTIIDVVDEGGGVYSYYLDVNIGSQTSGFCNFQRYYNNHSGVVEVYNQEDELLTTVNLEFRRENGENIAKLDVSKIALSELSSAYDATQETAGVDPIYEENKNLVSNIYIKYAERFDVSNGSTVELQTGVFRTDSEDLGALKWTNPSFDLFPLGTSYFIEDNPLNVSGSAVVGFETGYAQFDYDFSVSTSSQSPLLVHINEGYDFTGNSLKFSGELDFNINFGDASLIGLFIKGRNKSTGAYDTLLSVPAGIFTSGANTYNYEFEVSSDITNIAVNFAVIGIPTQDYQIRLNDWTLAQTPSLSNPSFDDGLTGWSQTQTLGLGSTEPITDNGDGSVKFSKTIGVNGTSPLSKRLHQTTDIRSGASIDWLLLFNVNTLPTRGNLVFVLYDGDNIMLSKNIEQRTGLHILEFNSSVYGAQITEMGAGVGIDTAIDDNYDVDLLYFQYVNPSADYMPLYVKSVFGVNQLQNPNGGNLGANVLRSLTGLSAGNYPKVLNSFEQIKPVSTNQSYVSFYASKETLDLKSNIAVRANYYNDDTLIAPNQLLYVKDVTSFTSDGINTIKVTSNFGTSYNQIRAQIYVFNSPVDLEPISEEFVIVKNADLETNCGVDVRYLNELGGWESFYFKHVEKREEDVKNKKYIERDVLNSLDGSFSSAYSFKETLSFDVTPVWTLQSGWLTENEYENLQKIKRSINVQIRVREVGNLTFGDWQTVEIANSRNLLFEAEKKQREVILTARLPKLVTQSL